MTTQEIEKAELGARHLANIPVRATKRSDLLSQIYRYRYVYLMLVPTFILLLTFNYYPAFMGLYRSFFEWDVGLPPKFVGWELH
ncbi:MAG: hypothetical protein R2932_57870 [Caldilineaceae bacterium]